MIKRILAFIFVNKLFNDPNKIRRLEERLANSAPVRELARTLVALFQRGIWEVRRIKSVEFKPDMIKNTTRKEQDLADSEPIRKLARLLVGLLERARWEFRQIKSIEFKPELMKQISPKQQEELKRTIEKLKNEIKKGVGK